MTELALFAEPKRQKKKRRPKQPASVAHAKCPKCNTFAPTGLVRSGAHLWWREHRVPTYGSISRVCTASNAPLCSVPVETQNPAEGAGLTCPCEGR